MPDGAGYFTQDFSGPALLRILTRPIKPIFVYRAITVYGLSFQTVPLITLWRLCRKSYNPHIAVTTWVWAVPRSLATTCGITIVFFSYGYLDVSVPHVRLPLAWDILNCFRMGCPIRTSPDQRLFAPPRSFSQLVTSFFASESQGIHLFALSNFVCSLLLDLLFE